MGQGPRPRLEAEAVTIIIKNNDNGYLNDRYQKTYELKEMLIKPGVSCYSDLPGQVSHLVGFWLF